MNQKVFDIDIKRVVLLCASLLVVTASIQGCRLLTRGYACDSDAACGNGQYCSNGTCEDGVFEPDLDGGNGPSDAGSPQDGGLFPDAGEPDDGGEPAANPDAGEPDDGGEPAVDPDAGEPDDGGVPQDGGEPDDAGDPFDAGNVDAGIVDAGNEDAGFCGGADLDRDRDNCGQCGLVCPGPNATCSLGFCSPEIIADNLGGGSGIIQARGGNLFYANGGRVVQRFATMPPFASFTANTTQLATVIGLEFAGNRIAIQEQGSIGTDGTLVLAPITGGAELSVTNIGGTVVSSSVNRGYGINGDTLLVLEGTNGLKRVRISDDVELETRSIPVSFPRGTSFDDTHTYWVADNNGVYKAETATLNDNGTPCGTLSFDGIVDVTHSPDAIFYLIDSSPTVIQMLTKVNCGVATIVNGLTVDSVVAIAATNTTLYYGEKSPNTIKIFAVDLSTLESTVVHELGSLPGNTNIASMAVDGPFLYWLQANTNERKILRQRIAP